MNIRGNNVPIMDVTATPDAAGLHTYLEWLSKHYKEEFKAIDQQASPENATALLAASIKNHMPSQSDVIAAVNKDPRVDAPTVQYNYRMISEASDQLPGLGNLTNNYVATLQRAAGYGVSIGQMYLLDDVARNINGGEKNYSDHVEKAMAGKSPEEKKRYVNEVLHTIEQGKPNALVAWSPQQLDRLQRGGYTGRAKGLRADIGSGQSVQAAAITDAAFKAKVAAAKYGISVEMLYHLDGVARKAGAEDFPDFYEKYCEDNARNTEFKSPRAMAAATGYKGPDAGPNLIRNPAGEGLLTSDQIQARAAAAKYGIPVEMLYHLDNTAREGEKNSFPDYYEEYCRLNANSADFKTARELALATGYAGPGADQKTIITPSGDDPSSSGLKITTVDNGKKNKLPKSAEAPAAGEPGKYDVGHKDNFGCDGGPVALEQLVAKIDSSYIAGAGVTALEALQKALFDKGCYAKIKSPPLADGHSDVDDKMGERTRAAIRQYLADNGEYTGDINGRGFGGDDFKNITTAISAIKNISATESKATAVVADPLPGIMALLGAPPPPPPPPSLAGGKTPVNAVTDIAALARKLEVTPEAARYLQEVAAKQKMSAEDYVKSEIERGHGKTAFDIAANDEKFNGRPLLLRRGPGIPATGGEVAAINTVKEELPIPQRATRGDYKGALADVAVANPPENAAGTHHHHIPIPGKGIATNVKHMAAAIIHPFQHKGGPKPFA